MKSREGCQVSVKLPGQLHNKKGIGKEFFLSFSQLLCWKHVNCAAHIFFIYPPFLFPIYFNISHNKNDCIYYRHLIRVSVFLHFYDLFYSLGLFVTMLEKSISSMNPAQNHPGNPKHMRFQLKQLFVYCLFFLYHLILCYINNLTYTVRHRGLVCSPHYRVCVLVCLCYPARVMVFESCQHALPFLICWFVIRHQSNSVSVSSLRHTHKHREQCFKEACFSFSFLY